MWRPHGDSNPDNWIDNPVCSPLHHGAAGGLAENRTPVYRAKTCYANLCTTSPYLVGSRILTDPSRFYQGLAHNHRLWAESGGTRVTFKRPWPVASPRIRPLAGFSPTLIHAAYPHLTRCPTSMSITESLEQPEPMSLAFTSTTLSAPIFITPYCLSIFALGIT